MTELARVIKIGIRSALENLHTSFPARVVRYDADLQQVDVQPLVKHRRTTENGEVVADRLPVIVCMPIMFPRMGSYAITGPIAAGEDGETVLVQCTEESLEVWLSRGGEVDPLDTRRNHLTDAVALVGLRDFAHAAPARPNDRMTVGKDNGLQLHIDGSKIRIGTDVAMDLDAVALASKVEQMGNDLRSFMESHVHNAGGLTSPPMGGTVTGISGSPTTSPPSIPALGSSVVEVKV